MTIRIKRRFNFDEIRIEIEEILNENISGETAQHGTHLWPSSVVLAGTG